MSTVQEIEAAIPKLTRAEVEQIRDWIDNYLEDQLELREEVVANLEDSRQEIAEGKYIIRHAEVWRSASNFVA